MSQHYSDPSRENDKWSLPDVEVFHLTESEAYDINKDNGCTCAKHESCECDAPAALEEGWYYWFCFPGCLPDSDPIGPFATEQEAIEDAQSNND